MNQQKIIQTIAAMGAGFIATKLLALTWRAVTGHRPPTNDEEDGTSLREVVMFAAISGAVAALARAFATRTATRVVAKNTSAR